MPKRWRIWRWESNPMALTVFYNEFDPFAAAWLRELILEGAIPDGIVDERSIEELTPSDVEGFDQCHFFAGIGGWAHALDLAGWDRPVWTGSCPCQPLSSAGQRKGHSDERHLWPALFRLIAECSPPVVFGEQIASDLGREWLAGIRLDLEDARYAVGSADLCAAGIGAPHIRQRLYWVAQRMGVPDRHGSQPWEPTGAPLGHGNTVNAAGRPSRMANAVCSNQRGYARNPRSSAIQSRGEAREADGHSANSAGSDSHWGEEYLICGDEKARRVKSGIFPVADGLPNRVGILRGAGNAIVPQVAAAFAEAFASVNPPEMTK